MAIALPSLKALMLAHPTLVEQQHLPPQGVYAAGSTIQERFIAPAKSANCQR
ncbi:hypothetical protein IFO70_17415 [Phormidium tenue FACHB-886]|nr:hypothetical protein [Phormidium tenue FACHB-886]